MDPGATAAETETNALAALAAKYGRPLALHAQWDADTAAEFQRLAASNPDRQPSSWNP